MFYVEVTGFVATKWLKAKLSGIPYMNRITSRRNTMIDCNDIVAIEYMRRYESLSLEKRRIIDTYRLISADKYQLNVIKRKRPKFKKGDVFVLNPCNEIYLYGIVLECNVSNACGDNLLVVCILKKSTNMISGLEIGTNFSENDILIKPQIVSKRYWTEGYFYTIENNEDMVDLFEYGFYRSRDRKFVDAYENELGKTPSLIELFALTTLTGIAYELHRELIIDHSFLSVEDQRTYENYLGEMLRPQTPEEKVLSEFERSILPFEFFKEHSRRYSGVLEDFEPYVDIFKQRSDELEGNGYDWEDLIKCYIKENFPKEYQRIKFDSEAGMLYMYCSNEALMREIVQKLASDLKENRLIEYVMKAKFSDLFDD